MQASSRSPVSVAVLTSASLVAIGLWGGGLLALGAFAAPAVFGNVPAPWSGDAMTIAFRRFDSFALGCAAVALIAEVGLAMMRKPILRRDLVRGVAVVAMGALEVWQALYISPRIEALHKSGAVRGVGEAGQELHAVHEHSKQAGEGVLLLALLVVVLHVSRSLRVKPAEGAPSSERHLPRERDSLEP
jgi:hypothetical protein